MAESKQSEKGSPGSEKDSPVKFFVGIGGGILLLTVTLMGKSSYTPRILDELLGLSAFVSQEISKKVDSGYSESITFKYDSQGQWLKARREILFYAEPGQTVKLTIRGNAGGAPNTTSGVEVHIDGVIWKNLGSAPYSRIQVPITGKLKSDVDEGAIHNISFHPKDLKPGDIAQIDCLILVYNK
jgi:hypothetical protein